MATETQKVYSSITEKNLQDMFRKDHPPKVEQKPPEPQKPDEDLHRQIIEDNRF